MPVANAPGRICLPGAQLKASALTKQLLTGKNKVLLMAARAGRRLSGKWVDFKIDKGVLRSRRGKGLPEKEIKGLRRKAIISLLSTLKDELGLREEEFKVQERAVKNEGREFDRNFTGLIAYLLYEPHAGPPLRKAERIKNTTRILRKDFTEKQRRIIMAYETALLSKLRAERWYWKILDTNWPGRLTKKKLAETRESLEDEQLIVQGIRKIIAGLNSRAAV